MVAVFFGVRYALKPLDFLSQRIQHRAVDDLRPVSEEGTPSETRALVNAINRLLNNLCDAGLAQQAFISSAAHQIRTPIAGLQTQLEPRRACPANPWNGSNRCRNRPDAWPT